ncbi:MAG: serine esterase [Bdellovibrionales bacterium]|nr:serine esterase [Bdellovibrionales bacterium]
MGLDIQCELVLGESRQPTDHPLILVLHGQGDSMEPFRDFPEEIGQPRFNYLLLNAPFRQGRGYAWYRSEPQHRPGIIKSTALIVELIYELIEEGWASEQIYLFGLSQGGLIAFQVALQFPLPLGGVIGSSTYIHFSRDWQKSLLPHHRRLPAIMTHGFEDREIPLREAQLDRQRLQKAGIRVEWLVMDKGHEVDEEIESPLIGRWILKQAEKRKSKRSRAKTKRPSAEVQTGAFAL